MEFTKGFLFVLNLDKMESILHSKKMIVVAFSQVALDVRRGQ